MNTLIEKVNKAIAEKRITDVAKLIKDSDATVCPFFARKTGISYDPSDNDCRECNKANKALYECCKAFYKANRETIKEKAKNGTGIAKKEGESVQLPIAVPVFMSIPKSILFQPENETKEAKKQRKAKLKEIKENVILQIKEAGEIGSKTYPGLVLSVVKYMRENYTITAK